MKTTSGQKIKIGLFTFTGLLVLVLAIFFIGNQKNLFSSTFDIYGTFRNVNGLQVGNNVRFAGINVGVVQAINIVNDSSVRVDLTLNSNVKKFIKKDAKLSIGSDGLMGDKLIVIAPGGISSNDEISGGGQLNAVNPIDVDKVVVKLTGIADNAERITNGLSLMVDKVNSGKGTLGKLLNDDKLANNLDATVKQAQSTIKNVHTTSSALNTDLKAAQNNFLLKGYFKKQKKKQQQDSIKKAQATASGATGDQKSAQKQK
ncbi:MlaD family protein [Mucilaginibacter sp. X4EP1]|uniref:MlaD family protein n=1 Tax=Mucilaginibacter sp. X4EP1 TaxID=2723092 RepID=UPI00216A5A2A|nr:MlaD family protein [Mucilaginibacter sp. X4EP1]MCS3816222.1 phospholipid/cholesterol/gamma-HCH transport system substrate-binding protein [Mucilaginibacter sp. X4EP1]